MAINNWFISRPIRNINPTLLVQLTGIMHGLCQGQVFSEELQIQYTVSTKSLGINKRLAELQDKNSGGARTHYALLSSLGLMFKTSDKRVYPTIAGEAIIASKDPSIVLRTQLSRLQYPSVHSKTIRLSDKFKVKPFLFILQLLFHPEIDDYITDLDISIATVVGKDNQRATVNHCVKLILQRRAGKSLEEILSEEWTDSNEKQPSYLTDIANTFTNYLRAAGILTTFKAGSTYRFKIVPENFTIDDLKRYLNEGLIPDFPNEQFQRRFGRYDRQKDNRNIGQKSSVNWKLLLLDADLLEMMTKNAGDSWIEDFTKKQAEKLELHFDIVSERVAIARTVDRSPFEENYLKQSIGGAIDATDFERLTGNIFSEIGFKTQLTGRMRRAGQTGSYADVYVEDPNSRWSAILDCKSTNRYDLPHSDIVLMQDYIDASKKFLITKDHELSVAGYVSGGFISTINHRLDALQNRNSIKMCAIRPSWLLSQLENPKDTRKSIAIEALSNGGQLI